MKESIFEKFEQYPGYFYNQIDNWNNEQPWGECAWVIDMESAQIGKRWIGVESPVEIFASDGQESYLDLRNDEPRIVLPGSLTPEFANFSFWHEMAHARQWERDYSCCQEAFVADYTLFQDGLQEFDVGWDNNPWHYSPFEAEAHLTALENMHFRVTRPGPGTPDMDEYYPGGLEGLNLNEQLIHEIGLEFRKGMGR